MSVSPPCCCGRCCCYTTASRVRGIERWEGRAVAESEHHTKQKFNKTHMNIKLNTKDMQIFIYNSFFFASIHHSLYSAIPLLLLWLLVGKFWSHCVFFIVFVIIFYFHYTFPVIRYTNAICVIMFWMFKNYWLWVLIYFTIISYNEWFNWHRKAISLCCVILWPFSIEGKTPLENPRGISSTCMNWVICIQIRNIFFSNTSEKGSTKYV